MKQTIDVSPDDMKIISKILLKYVPEYEVRVYGSRVSGNAKKTSDMDIAVMTDTPMDIMLFIDLKEALSESDLPFKVDVTDWAKTSNNFKQIIEQNYVVIQQRLP